MNESGSDSARVRRSLPRPFFALFVLVGVGGALLGLFGLVDAGSTCDPAFPDKCLPTVLMAGRGLWIGVGSVFAAVGGIRLLDGRRPWVTWLALTAGVIDCTVGAWFAFALLTGLFRPAIPFYSIVWPAGVMVALLGFGVNLLRAAWSDRVMKQLLR